MLNFGLTELRLVPPRDGWPNPHAGPAASGADVVLADAVVFDSLPQAVADGGHIYAPTLRTRGVAKTALRPQGAPRGVHERARRDVQEISNALGRESRWKKV